MLLEGNSGGGRGGEISAGKYAIFKAEEESFVNAVHFRGFHQAQLLLHFHAWIGGARSSNHAGKKEDWDRGRVGEGKKGDWVGYREQGRVLVKTEWTLCPESWKTRIATNLVQQSNLTFSFPFSLLLTFASPSYFIESYLKARVARWSVLTLALSWPKARICGT